MLQVDPSLWGDATHPLVEKPAGMDREGSVSAPSLAMGDAAMLCAGLAMTQIYCCSLGDLTSPGAYG